MWKGLSALPWLLTLTACGESLPPSLVPPPDTLSEDISEDVGPSLPPEDTSTSTDMDIEVPQDGADSGQTPPEDTSTPEEDTTSDVDESDSGDLGDACQVENQPNVALGEASGAAWVDEHHVMLISDSGGKGKALLLNLREHVSHPFEVPLGCAGDDFEGLERGPDGTIYSLSSSGWIRRYAVTLGQEIEVQLLEEPYPLSADSCWECRTEGPVCLDSEHASPWVCSPTGVNCGPDFEGLCLHPAPAEGACVGYAASRTTGELVCLTRTADGRLQVDPSRIHKVMPEGQLSTCAYQPVAPYRLFVGGNVYSLSSILEVMEDGQRAKWAGAQAIRKPC